VFAFVGIAAALMRRTRERQRRLSLARAETVVVYLTPPVLSRPLSALPGTFGAREPGGVAPRF
jgi:hypothetical protein